MAASPRRVAQLTSTNAPGDLPALLLELVDPPGQRRLAGAGRARSAGAAQCECDRHALDLLDQRG